MFQNVFMTALTPMRDSSEVPMWKNEGQALEWSKPRHKLSEKDVCLNIIKKKKKRIRTAFTTDQLRALEKTYARTKYIDREERNKLANSLSIGERCLKVWFQNRRMKEKKEIAEGSVEYCIEPVSSPSIVSSPSPSPETKPTYQDLKQHIVIQNSMYNTDYVDNGKNTQFQCYQHEYSQFSSNHIPAPTNHYYNHIHDYGNQYNTGIYQNDYDVQMSYLQENQNSGLDWSPYSFDITHL